MGVAAMAKKAIKPKGGEAIGPRKTVLTIKGTDEWREWLEGFAEFSRTPTSTLVDHALVAYAKAEGYTAEAPKR